MEELAAKIIAELGRLEEEERAHARRYKAYDKDECNACFCRAEGIRASLSVIRRLARQVSTVGDI